MHRKSKTIVNAIMSHLSAADLGDKYDDVYPIEKYEMIQNPPQSSLEEYEFYSSRP